MPAMGCKLRQQMIHEKKNVRIQLDSEPMVFTIGVATPVFSWT